MSGFRLHPRLAADTVRLGSLPLSELLMMNEARYPWFILVPRRAGVEALHELAPDDQQRLLAESNALSRALVAAFAPDRLNLALLGNLVPQLHFHHVARFRDDAAWPGPVWGRFEPQPMTPAEARARAERLLAGLPPSADLKTTSMA